MAYQIQRHEHFTESLELVDEAGNVAHSLKVDLNPGTVVESLSRKYLELFKIKQEIDSIDMSNLETAAEAYDKLGNAVTSLMGAVFGEEQTNVILQFFGENYSDMIQAVIPFINNVVVPEVRRLAKENKKGIMEKYNRKQRRFLMRVK